MKKRRVEVWKKKKKVWQYCNEILEASKMAYDNTPGAVKRWTDKYGVDEYFCSVVCDVIRRASLPPTKKERRR